jgi:hypothetical protein
MQRIQKISHFFRICFTVYMVCLPLGILFHWFVTTSEWIKGTAIDVMLKNGGMHMGIASGSHDIKIHEHHFSYVAKLIGCGGSLVLTGLYMTGVYYLIQLFRLYEKGSLFTRQHVTYMKNIGIVMAVYSTFGMVLTDMIHVLAATWDKGPGNRLLSIGYGTTNIEVLFIAGLMILTSWIMAEGFKLKEEQELTI